MNKKLLLTVLAAGLVFPTATASAEQTVTDFVVDQNGNKTGVEKPTGHNLLSGLDSNKPEDKQLIDAFSDQAKKDAEAKAKEEALKKQQEELKKQEEAILKQLGDSKDLTPKEQTTTKAGETTTTKKPDGKVSKATQKAKSSAKTGAKKLPKTSAAK